MIITTGRFSREAETYAQNLNDVRIEFIDSAKLAHMISVTFPNGALPTNLCAAIKTTADADFPQVFAQSIFSKSRFQSGKASKSPVRVKRVTRYETFFIATYYAVGTKNTTIREFSEDWTGEIWISAEGAVSPLRRR